MEICGLWDNCGKRQGPIRKCGWNSPWTKHMAMAGSSPEFLLPDDSGHGGPTRVGEKEKGATRVRLCLLPRLGRCRGGGAPAVVFRLRRATAWAR
jgi:hypothetical protein